VVGGAVDRIEESIFPISRDGEMIGVISAIPYLSETSLRSSRGSTDESDRAKALEREISRYYDRAYSISRDIGYGSSIPLVATGHLSTLMRYMSGATRDIYIGSLELFNREMSPIRLYSTWTLPQRRDSLRLFWHTQGFSHSHYHFDGGYYQKIYYWVVGYLDGGGLL